MHRLLCRGSIMGGDAPENRAMRRRAPSALVHVSSQLASSYLDQRLADGIVQCDEQLVVRRYSERSVKRQVGLDTGVEITQRLPHGFDGALDPSDVIGRGAFRGVSRDGELDRLAYLVELVVVEVAAVHEVEHRLAHGACVDRHHLYTAARDDPYESLTAQRPDRLPLNRP